VDGPEPSDCIVVLEGDAGDARLRHALDLLRDDYGKELVIDAPTALKYGRPTYEYAQEYASKQPPATRARNCARLPAASKQFRRAQQAV
jgi:hypothetical protein